MDDDGVAEAIEKAKASDDDGGDANGGSGGDGGGGGADDEVQQTTAAAAGAERTESLAAGKEKDDGAANGNSDGGARAGAGVCAAPNCDEPAVANVREHGKPTLRLCHKCVLLKQHRFYARLEGESSSDEESDADDDSKAARKRRAKRAKRAKAEAKRKEQAAAEAKASGGAGGSAAASQTSRRVPFLQLFRFADALDSTLMIIGAVMAVVQGAVLPGFALIFGELLDALNGSPDPNELYEATARVSIYFLYIGAGTFVVVWIKTTCWMLAGERQVHRVRQAYLRAVVRQEVGWFDREGSNEIYGRMAADTTVLHEALGEKLATGLQFISTFVFGFALGFIQGWELTLVILAVTPLLAIAGGVMMVLMAQMTSSSQAAYAKAGAVAFEVLSAVRTVASFSGEERACAHYTRELRVATRTNQRKGFVQGLGMGAVMLLMYCSYALALWFGATRIALGPNSDWTGGKVLTVFFSVLMGAFALGQMAPSLTAVGNAQGAAYVLFKTIARRPRVDATSARGKRLPALRGAIEVRNVHFRYPTRPEAPVLQGLSISVEPGQTVALVGSSGCGKSSTIQLLLRFYEPDAGGIDIDGEPLTALNLRWWRQQIGYVPQQATLFSATIADNIAYGVMAARDDDDDDDDDDAAAAAGAAAAYSREDIEAAAKAANAHDFITSFPDGYDTLCGPKGASMSGGQAQRIAIARALLRNPRVMLLDEATSALDSKSEAVVQDALDRVMKDRTTIVIAHRLSTIRDADRIYVIDQGKVIQAGTYTELVKSRKGKFYSLIKMQGMTTLKRGAAEKFAELDDADDDVDPDDADADADGKGKAKAGAGDGGDGGDAAAAAASSTNKAATTEQETKANKKNKKKKKTKKDGGGDDDDEQDDDDDETLAKVTGPMRKVVALNAPEWWLYVIGVVAAAVNGALMPLFAILFSEILTAFYPSTKPEDGHFSLVFDNSTGAPLVPSSFAITPQFYDDVVPRSLTWVYFFVGLGALTLVANVLQLGMFGAAGERLTGRLRERTFRAMLRNEIGWFDDKRHSVGWLTSKLSSDASLVQGVFGGALALMVQNVATVAVGLFIAFYYSWLLTFAVFAIIPLLMLGQVTEMMAMKGLTLKSVERMNRANAVATEAISNMRTVAAFTTERAVVERFVELSAAPRRTGIIGAFVSGAALGFGQGAMFAAYCAIFWFGGWLVANNDPYVGEGVTFTDMMNVVMALMMMAMGLGQSAAMAPDSSKASAAARSILGLMLRRSELDPLGDGGERPEIVGRIELRNVRFRYPTRPDARVLEGLSVSVEPGQTLALVGESGCGKSTSVQLLERFYDVSDGEVLIDGTNVRAINVAHLRASIGMVQQMPVLFTGTVAENIAYGHAGTPTREAIEQAARDANAHDFISRFPDGYDTHLGEGGAQLSGGQKQRISIARAILRNPKVLLLDEATSALDTKSERIVQDALERVMKGRTSVVIAHRLNTIRDADVIAVVHNGRVVERGTHDELMAKRRRYYRLVARQGGVERDASDGGGDGAAASALVGAPSARDAATGVPKPAALVPEVSFRPGSS